MLRVGFIGGEDTLAAWRLATAEMPGVVPAEQIRDADGDLLDAYLATLDALLVASPTADHFRIAEAAARRGVHLFLDWPPATSVEEGQAIVRLAEEAGIEVGISRSLRFHPALAPASPARRASLIVLSGIFSTDVPPAWPLWLADAIDLCCALAQTTSVQRIDAEAVRREAPWPVAVAFGLRFHNGSYAQASLRCTDAPSHLALYAEGPDLHLDADLGVANAPPSDTYAFVLRHAEMQAFLRVLLDRQPAPVTLLDGLHTMRLVERLMAKLR